MISNKKYPLFAVSGFCAILIAAAACAPQKTVRKTEEAVETSTTTAKGEEGVESGEANLRGSEFQTVEDLKPIRFDFNAYVLDEPARDQLKANAEYLKSHASLEILVAGYCDERGTEAYNLALGQRRAKAVREYYTHLGISGKSMATISYGKEKQLCPEHTEDCWAQNRRAETTVRMRAASKHKTDSDVEMNPQ